MNVTVAPDNSNGRGFSLLQFLFLLVLLANGYIFADLFLSVHDSPLTWVLIRVVIMLAVLSFLAGNGFRYEQIRGRGWYFILTGFSLLLLESVIELVYLLPVRGSLPAGLDSDAVDAFKEIVCLLLGFFCMAYGFFLWIPSIIQARRQVEQTASMLEEMVAERTRSLEESNRKLQHSKNRLEEAARLKNEFLASFSHELKTPLNSILGFCRLLESGKQGPLGERQQKSVGIIYSNSRSLLERIDRILDYAKLEFEKVTPEYSEVSPEELLREVASVFEPLLRGSELELAIKPPEDQEATVRTDRKILGQLIMAVLDNAVKFTDKGTVSLAAGIDRDRGAWWVRVEDTGQGIPPAEVPFIFDAFRQGDGTLSRPHGGLGLGLSIARRLNRLLGGRIDVDSEVGKGSAFTVLLPLEPGGNIPGQAGPAAASEKESPENEEE